MDRIYRVLGKRGRVTIPHEIRSRMGLACNDVLSFTETDGRTVAVRKEKICGHCEDCRDEAAEAVTLEGFLDGLTPEEQRTALVHLSVRWAEKQGGGAYA